MSTLSPPAQLAGTPAGRALRWLLDRLADPAGARPEQVVERLSPRALAAIPAAEWAASLAGIGAELGAVELDRVDVVTPHEAAARLLTADGRAWLLRCAVEEAPPYRIEVAQLSPARKPTDAGCGVPVPWGDVRGGDPVGTTELPPALASRVDERLAALREELRLPGLLAAVVADGRRVHWRGLGFAEVATGRRPAPRTAVRLASLSAALTALAVHRLVAAGRLRLDEPAAAHLGWLEFDTPGGEPVLLRHLLTHTAGLAPDPRLPVGVPAGAPLPELRDLLGPVLTTALPPGERFMHSPVGYALLGDIVARAAGRPFTDYVAGQVLDPLGMRHTSFLLDDRVARQPMCGYDVDFDEVLVATGTEVVLGPAAAAASTLDDLGTLAAALCAPGQEAMVAAAMPTGVPAVAVTLGGLFHGRAAGRPLVWHCGGWPGALAGLWVAPDDGVGLVVAGNAFSPARLAALDAAGTELVATLASALPGRQEPTR